MRTQLVPDKRFDDIHYITLDNINDIVDDFKSNILSNIPKINIDSVVGLGTTRMMLNKLEYSKTKSSDIDLLATSNIDNRIFVTEFCSYLDGKNIKNFISFGNIVSISYPFNESNYQIDLMVANASEFNDIHEYMYRFKFWSDEPHNPNSDLIIKGAHRSEFIKSLVRAVGLSAAENGFKEFIWNNSFDDINEFILAFEKKVKRFRKPEKKEQCSKLIDIVKTQMKSMSQLKSFLVRDNKLITRFTTSKFNNLQYGYDVLIDMLFDKVDCNNNWKDVLNSRFVHNDCVPMLERFDSCIEFSKTLLTKGIITENDIKGIFHNMRDGFENGRANVDWNDKFVSYVEMKFPFMKAMW